MSVYEYNLDCYYKKSPLLLKKEFWKQGDVLVQGKQTYVFLSWSKDDSAFALLMHNGRRLCEIELDDDFPVKKI